MANCIEKSGLFARRVNLFRNPRALGHPSHQRADINHGDKGRAAHPINYAKRSRLAEVLQLAIKGKVP
jgi:hypothetical protein